MGNPWIVQFLHPGGEHEPDQPDRRSWNRHNHQRTFLRCPGAYVGSQGTILRESVVFWGEWEPPVRVLRRYQNVLPGLPRYICEPYLTVPSAFCEHQNTDPFVFGDRFLYAICQQHTSKGPSALQRLERGSLILFGSHKSRQFHLDTVFVVSESADHDAESYRDNLRGRVASLYVTVALDPWYASVGRNSGPRSRGRLYFGATPADPVEGMFSFFPCLPELQAPSGFVRPPIRLSDHISDRLTQKWQGTLVADLATAREAWDEVARQVQSAKLELGVHADLPRISP